MTSNPTRAIAPLIHLTRLLRPYAWRIALAVTMLLAASAQSLFLPSLLRDTVDQVFVDGAREILDGFIVLLIALLCLAVTISLRYFLVMWIGERVVADLRKLVFAHILQLDTTFFVKARAGEIASRLSGDTELIRSAFGASASMALRNLLLFTGAFALMIYNQPQLTTLMVVVFPPLALLLILIYRRLRTYSQIAREKLADAVGLASEVIDASRTIQVENFAPEAKSRFDARVDDSFEFVRKSLVFNAFGNFTFLSVFSFAILGTVWLATERVIAGEMTPGELLQFLVLAAMLGSSVSEFGQLIGELGRISGAAARLGEILATPSTITSPQFARKIVTPAKGQVLFESVSFDYDADAKNNATLRDVNLMITPGERVGVVGPSGAGKSTLFALLLRLYDPQKGKIAFDHTPLTQLDLEDFRRHIAYVPQEPVIFASSIADNIAFGRRASDRRLEEVAREANALEFIDDLPNGMQSVVGPRGITLSLGQKQRIAIARALLRDPALILFDEATSALDVINEAKVMEALGRLMKGRTTLMIAHRLSTVRDMSRIIVLDQGKVVEDGPPAELEARGHLYAKMTALQQVRQEKENLWSNP